jgi:hypothetical protein
VLLILWATGQTGDGVLEFFNVKLSIAFADKVAEDFDKIFKEEKTYAKSDKEQKIARRYMVVVKKAEEFSKSNRLNFYKKGKLLTHLKFRLLELGHHEAQAEHAVRTLLTHI